MAEVFSIVDVKTREAIPSIPDTEDREPSSVRGPANRVLIRVTDSRSRSRSQPLPFETAPARPSRP